MITVQTEADVLEPRRQREVEEGLTVWVTRYCGQEVGDLYAIAHLVDNPPNTEGGAHFHAADQFQVVMGGEGFYGKTPVKRLSVHYAGAYTPYGPIKMGDHGLKWFTLRNGKDPGGIKWMPQEREQLRAGGRKPRTVHGEPEIPMQADGLGAWRYQLKPGEKIVGQAPATGRGQYWIVLDGGGKLAGKDFPEKEGLLFVAPNEAAVTAEGGPNGFDVLAVQFPTNAAN